MNEVDNIRSSYPSTAMLDEPSCQSCGDSGEVLLGEIIGVRRGEGLDIGEYT